MVDLRATFAGLLATPSLLILGPTNLPIVVASIAIEGQRIAPSATILATPKLLALSP
jgi:hypothetical protein